MSSPMKNNSQKFSLNKEQREDKRWNRSYKETKKSFLRTYLENLTDNYNAIFGSSDIYGHTNNSGFDSILGWALVSLQF